jgi:CDP-paratose 2-epimerase
MILVTGSLGLVGLETALFFLNLKYEVIGIDNNTRKYLFGENGDNSQKLKILKNYDKYEHHDFDLKDKDTVNLFLKDKIENIDCVVHAAAQPSHDWAQKDPIFDLENNCLTTLYILEMIRKYNPNCVFIYVSTNKVYGDNPNLLNLIEKEKRYDLEINDKFYFGVNESMSIDNTLHSLFGVSKLSADLMTQEYGRYFNLKTVCFRCGCITGKNHSGTSEHGFLSYLIKTYKNKETYLINGYKGKQVRDNLHAYDLAKAFYLFYKNPKIGEIYNIGGGRENSISILELQKILNLKIEHNDLARKGDHVWWITDNSKFKKDYDWQITYNIKKILLDLVNDNS